MQYKNKQTKWPRALAWPAIVCTGKVTRHDTGHRALTEYEVPDQIINRGLFGSGGREQEEGRGRLAGWAALGFDPGLESELQAGQHVVVVQLLAEDEPAHRVVVSEQSHHVLE